ncbi:MAG: primosomal protein N' [Thalassolituus oleivorans]|uniref:primosomal protein N' n=1 Tax=Thalassolituus oleivorans TaxID=187493 RepID=UPI001B489CCB|nr:primosomal protein N' [Thalassolituus oleivorans]MBQ0726605.1 primosomal protein N' [Thalassolituus oleivorans]
MSFFVVEIALPVPLHRTFDYLPVQNDTQEHYLPGQRVRAEFGRQLLTGIVVGCKNHTEVPQNKLRALLERCDDAPLINEHSLTLCRWLADYYHHSLGEVLEHMLPVMLRRGCALSEANERIWRRVASVDANPKLRGDKQIALWKKFQHSECWVHANMTAAGFALAQLKRLAELELIVEEEALPLPNIPAVDPVFHTLNAEQQAALHAIEPYLGRFKACLLEGVTGSGKTEVYLRLINQVLSKGQQALVLVPEIGLTPQTVQRFQERFNVPVALLHSGLNDRERLQGWRQVSEGKARILIGTRSAVFTPMPELGLIILDEEHDGSFKQQDGLRYSARDFALVRAHQSQVPIVLGSATPSLETLHNALTGRYLHLKLTQRAGKAKPPQMKLHSILHQPLTAGFAQPVLAAMQKHLENNKQVLVFINRRGFAPLLACRDCGWMAECRRCDARLTLHQYPPHLHCHHCDFQQGIPAHCPQCQSHKVEAVGQGTERIEEQLAQLFPQRPIRRVDRDTVRNKQAFDELFNEIHTGGSCILVGTQMLAKGHHFPDVTLVVILDSDAGLFSADFRGMEHSAQLIEQVSGRAGRADSPGQVWIQTLYADHPQLNLLIDSGYHALALSMLQERQLQQLPPYTHMALLRSECEDRIQTQQLLQQARAFIQDWLRQHAHDNAPVTLLGPFPAIMERRAGRFRYQLQLFCPGRVPLHQTLEALVQYLQQLKGFGKVRWNLDVDPLDTI